MKKGKMKQLLALMLAGMLTVGSVGVPVFGIETGGSYDTAEAAAAGEAVGEGHPEEISEEEYEADVEEAAAEEPDVDKSAVEEVDGKAVEKNEVSDAAADSTAAESIVEWYTVTLDANGGYFENEWDDSIGEYVEQAVTVTKQIPVGGIVALVPVYNVEGTIASFRGWSLERDGELATAGQEEYAPAESCTLYAVWEIKGNASDEPEESEEAEDPETVADLELDAEPDTYAEQNPEDMDYEENGETDESEETDEPEESEEAENLETVADVESDTEPDTYAGQNSEDMDYEESGETDEIDESGEVSGTEETTGQEQAEADYSQDEDETDTQETYDLQDNLPVEDATDSDSSIPASEEAVDDENNEAPHRNSTSQGNDFEDVKKKTVDVAQEKENLSRDSMINDGKKLGVKETAIIEPSEEETIGETAEYSASFVQTEYNGHMYQLFNEGVSWSTAESRCEEKGGHLVTITSKREYDFCKTLLGDMAPKYCWMGATHSSGSWKWITGESWDYTAWSPSQPNGSGGGTYALMQNFKGVDAAWNWDDQGNSGTSISEKYQGSPYFQLTKNYCYICEWERIVTGVEEITDDYQKADRKICITWDGILKNLKYEVQYSSTKDFKQNVVSEKVSREEEGEKVAGYTTKALERLKTYYFRVRPIYRLSDKDFPGGWSDVITARTTNSLLSSELWGFNNFSDPFSEYYFERFFTHDSAVGRSSQNNMNGKDGLCNGMCITASLIMDYEKIPIKSFGDGSFKSLNKMDYTQGNTEYSTRVNDLIRFAHAFASDRHLEEVNWDPTYTGLEESLRQYMEGNGHLPIFELVAQKKDGSEDHIHAVIGLALIKASNDESLIKIYDPDYAGRENLFIHIKKNDNYKWEYKQPKLGYTYIGRMYRDDVSDNGSYWGQTGKENDVIWFNTNETAVFWENYSNNISIANSNLIVTGITNATYNNGKDIEQKPTIVLYGKTLVVNRDYALSYSNNNNAGTATMTITGINPYTGSVSKTFKINKATQSLTAKTSASQVAVGKTATVSTAGAKGTLSFKSSDPTIATVSSTGKVTAKRVGKVIITATSAATSNFNKASASVRINVVPAATSSLWATNQANGVKLTWKKVAGASGYLIYRGGAKIDTIKSGSTVTYTDTKANTNGAKYIYKIIANASTGTSTLSKATALFWVARPAIKTLKSSSSGKMFVAWGKNAKGTGYQIQYSSRSDFKTQKTVTVNNAKTVSKTISGLAKKHKYYVRVRTYKKGTVGDTKYYSAWSVAKTVKTK